MTAITLAPMKPATPTATSPRSAATTSPDPRPQTFAAELEAAQGGTEQSQDPTVAEAPADMPATASISPGDSTSQPTSAAFPSLERRDRRHVTPGAALDATSGTAPIIPPAPAIADAIQGSLATAVASTLTAAGEQMDDTAGAPDRASVPGPTADAAATTTTAAVPEILGAAASPRRAVPMNTPAQIGSTARPSVSSAALVAPLVSTGPVGPSPVAVAGAASLDSGSSPDRSSTRPPTDRGSRAVETPVVSASAPPPSLPVVAAAVAPDEPGRLAARVSNGRPTDPGTIVGTIGLSPASTPVASAPAAVTNVGIAGPPTPPLNAQLAPALFHLRSSEAGAHILTLTVAPEEVGPVTVRAHVGADGIRIELSAPTAQGRSALDAILPELRRDLSQGGMNSVVSLASPGFDGSGDGRPPFDGAGGSLAGDRGSDRRSPAPDTPAGRESSSSPSTSLPALRSGAIALDVLV